MAKNYTPTDAHAIMNLLVEQATGQKELTVTDTSSFISAGEKVLSTGTENVLNSLGIVMGRLYVAARPYTAKLEIINALNTAMYTNRMRKISYYARENVAAGFVNSDLFTNFESGYTNGQNIADGNPKSTKSMWEQNLPVALEMNFGGSDVWQTSQTIARDQLKIAFRGEDEFMRFMDGSMTEKANDIASNREAFNRMILLNKIASVYDMSEIMKGSSRNLTAEFNTKYGTSYTSEELRTTHLEEFLKFFVTEFKLASDYMENRSANYHWSPAKTVNGVNYRLLRHTPKDRQRSILYTPLFTEARANVLPDIFNPQYLDISQYEGVTYWQDINTPSAINVTPAIVDAETGEQKAGEAVNLPYVIGILYDVDGMMSDYQLDDALSTPIEARKRYYNIWYSFARNGINDNTENSVIFYMADPA